MGLFFQKKQSLRDACRLLEYIGDGVLMTNKDERIIFSNASAQHILGYTREELHGTSPLNLLKALSNKGKPITKTNAAITEAIRLGKKTLNATRQFKKKNGEIFWASISVAPIPYKGHAGAIIIFRDITEEKKVEEYNIDFARIASHQLRSPLGNLLWSTEYLLSEKPGKLTKHQKTYIEDTYHQLRDMNTLVNDLLHVSSLKEKQKKKIPPHKIGTVVRKVAKSLTSYAKANNVKIVVKDTTKQAKVLMSENDLVSIVQNIVENAIRYAFANTIITVSVKKEIVDKKSHILFSCTNEGIGIPSKMQPFIFAKFFRANNAVKKHGDGTGLGMYITHELVTRQGGEIWFTSEQNKQTTFYIRFKQ